MEHLTRVSTRSSQKDLYKFMQGLLQGFHQHLQDRLTASLTKLIMIVIEGPSRGSYKTFIQETPKSIPEELSYKHYRASSRSQCMHFLEDFKGNSTRSSHKDLYMIMQGTLREDFRKISTRSSHKDFYKITQGHHTGFHQDLHKIFSQGLLTKIFIISAPRLQVISKIFMQGPRRGFRQDLHKIFFKRTSTRPWPRSLYKGLRECIVKLSQGCHRRTFQRTPKISLPGPLRISWKYGATTRPICHAWSAGLRERSHNEHSTTMRAIRHAQSEERLAQTHVGISPSAARTPKHEHWKSENGLFFQIRHFLNSTRCCPWRQFHKPRLSNLSKHCPSSHVAPATNMTSETTVDPCVPTFKGAESTTPATGMETVSDVVRLSCKTTFKTSKCHGHSSKTERRTGESRPSEGPLL